MGMRRSSFTNVYRDRTCSNFHLNTAALQASICAMLYYNRTFGEQCNLLFETRSRTLASSRYLSLFSFSLIFIRWDGKIFKTASFLDYHNYYCTPMDPFTWPSKSRVISSNLHTAAQWGYGGVAMRTCRKRWTIWRGGERGSGISVLMAQDDDDDNYYYYCFCFCCCFILIIFLSFSLIRFLNLHFFQVA